MKLFAIFMLAACFFAATVMANVDQSANLSPMQRVQDCIKTNNLIDCLKVITDIGKDLSNFVNTKEFKEFKAKKLN